MKSGRSEIGRWWRALGTARCEVLWPLVVLSIGFAVLALRQPLSSCQVEAWQWRRPAHRRYHAEQRLHLSVRSASSCWRAWTACNGPDAAVCNEAVRRMRWLERYCGERRTAVTALPLWFGRSVRLRLPPQWATTDTVPLSEVQWWLDVEPVQVRISTAAFGARNEADAAPGVLPWSMRVLYRTETSVTAESLHVIDRVELHVPPVVEDEQSVAQVRMPRVLNVSFENVGALDTLNEVPPWTRHRAGGGIPYWPRQLSSGPRTTRGAGSVPRANRLSAARAQRRRLVRAPLCRSTARRETAPPPLPQIPCTRPRPVVGGGVWVLATEPTTDEHGGVWIDSLGCGSPLRPAARRHTRGGNQCHRRRWDALPTECLCENRRGRHHRLPRCVAGGRRRGQRHGRRSHRRHRWELHVGGARTASRHCRIGCAPQTIDGDSVRRPSHIGRPQHRADGIAASPTERLDGASAPHDQSGGGGTQADTMCDRMGHRPCAEVHRRRTVDGATCPTGKRPARSMRPVRRSAFAGRWRGVHPRRAALAVARPRLVRRTAPGGHRAVRAVGRIAALPGALGRRAGPPTAFGRQHRRGRRCAVPQTPARTNATGTPHPILAVVARSRRAAGVDRSARATDALGAHPTAPCPAAVLHHDTPAVTLRRRPAGSAADRRRCCSIPNRAHRPACHAVALLVRPVRPAHAARRVLGHASYAVRAAHGLSYLLSAKQSGWLCHLPSREP
eukprot:ctg_1472.g347